MGDSEVCLLPPPYLSNVICERNHSYNKFLTEHIQGQADLCVFIQHMVLMLPALSVLYP